jgi:hypothetical protein
MRCKGDIRMRLSKKIAAALLGLAALPAAAAAAVIGGTYYAPQYDYREFFAAADGRNFQVILAGNPPLGVDPNTVARELLPLMQAAKPRPALTFTYADPPERPRPYYRLVLVFDPANDYGSNSVCAGIPPRFKPGQPGVFYVFAVYCRNDQVLSETTAWTAATAPNDPRIADLFRQLFQVIWSDSPALRPQRGGAMDRN